MNVIAGYGILIVNEKVAVLLHDRNLNKTADFGCGSICAEIYKEFRAILSLTAMLSPLVATVIKTILD